MLKLRIAKRIRLQVGCMKPIKDRLMKALVTLKNFTEGQIVERTDALGKCYL